MTKHPENKLQRLHLKEKDATKTEKRSSGKVWKKLKEGLQERDAENAIRDPQDRRSNF